MPKRVVLASASSSRAQILRGAGVQFDVDRAAVDEDAVKQSMRAEGADAEAVAVTLAELKAMRVSPRHANALVIGADQILDCNGTWFDKPANLDHARAHLKALAGRSHELITAACVAINGSIVWHHVDRARLTMRELSDRFVDVYLADCGDSVLGSVGAYRVEDKGIQLFSRIEGSHFTILGLPLIPLLDFLRAHQVVLE